MSARGQALKQDVAKDSGSFLRKIVPDFSGHTEEADSTGKPQR